MFHSTLFLLILPSIAAALGIEAVVAIEPYWADPCLLLVGDLWYSFSSSPGGGVNIPAAVSSDSYSWTRVENSDLLPNLPGWALDDGNIWAPDVSQRADGVFVLYFTATFAGSSPAYHCIGVATSKDILGPFIPTSDTPWTCDASEGGAIDPNLFHDTISGNTYVVWKVDGNNFGNGGNCNNGIAPIHSTPIMIQQVSTTDYFTPIGSAIQILDRSTADGPLIEAPALIQGGGHYFLFFSSNCYSGTLYDLSYAFSTSVTGPYTKSSAPLLVTGTFDGVPLISPGSCDIVSLAGSLKIAFHGDVGTADPNLRGMYIMDAEISGTSIIL